MDFGGIYISIYCKKNGGVLQMIPKAMGFKTKMV